MKTDDLKLIVKDKYGEIARKSYLENSSNSCCGSSCCGTSGCCSDLEFSMIDDDYQNLEGYLPDADLGLGCGVPTQFAGIRMGDHVLDLGSGAGNDCFVARALAGESGHVTGLDFTDEMLVKARLNASKLGFDNVEFVKGDIEEMPLPDNRYDLILSNCVLNLVPDKTKAFSEMMRVLKPGGHFCISDVVIKGDLPEKIRQDAVMYVGCVSGALEMDDYLKTIRDRGFRNVKVHKQKNIVLPDEVLQNYLSEEDLKAFQNSGSGIFSITVTADK
jgi:ubiquinone/menaquinone biosynthesis C-methylase UbiE